MERKICKISWFIILAWAIIASACGIVFAMTYDTKLLASDSANASASMFFDISYWITAILFVISVVLALGFAAYYLALSFVEEKKKAMRTVFVILAIGFVFLVSFLFSSSSDVPLSFFEKVGADYGSSRAIGTGLVSVYLLGAGAVMAVLYAEVSKKLK